LVAADHVADGVVAHVAHVQRAGRVRQHRQAEELRLAGLFGHLEGARVLPEALRGGLDQGGLVGGGFWAGGLDGHGICAGKTGTGSLPQRGSPVIRRGAARSGGPSLVGGCVAPGRTVVQSRHPCRPCRTMPATYRLLPFLVLAAGLSPHAMARSEERRVGTERRARWSTA